MGFCLSPLVSRDWTYRLSIRSFRGYRCIGVKYIQSIINQIMWVEGNLQDGVEDILNELFEFLSVIIGILGFLYIPYVLFIRPAYQRKVLKKEWWQILGHTKSDQDETEWNVRFPSLTHGYPSNHPWAERSPLRLTVQKVPLRLPVSCSGNLWLRPINHLNLFDHGRRWGLTDMTKSICSPCLHRDSFVQFGQAYHILLQ